MSTLETEVCTLETEMSLIRGAFFKDWRCLTLEFEVSTLKTEVPTLEICLSL